MTQAYQLTIKLKAIRLSSIMRKIIKKIKFYLRSNKPEIT
jgi:hypothetical protein